MRTTKSTAPIVVGLIAAISLCASSGLAQQAEVQQPEVTVPRLVQFSGMVKEAAGKPAAGITFALYKDQQGSAPIWTEMQNVALDESGRYTVLLGSSKPDGLPRELFTSVEARWLSVEPEGQPEQPRVLLLSVPYALKAADAETLGGLPASAFVRAVPTAASGAAIESVKPADAAASVTGLALAGSGTFDFIPLWTPDGSTLGNSILFQSTTSNIGVGTTTPAAKLDVKGSTTVRGALSLPTAGTATATTGKNSQPLNLTSSAFSSSVSTAVNQTFRWQAEPMGNNTASPSGTLNLLFGSGTNPPAETGLHIDIGGVLTFAPTQTFPGVGTITGVTAGSGLAGGGTNGSVNLGLLTTCAVNQVLQWNGSAWVCSSAGNGTITGVTAGADLSGGGTSGNVTLNLDTTKVPQLNSVNTFTGNQGVIGTITATGSVGVGTTSPATMLDVFSTSNANGPMGQFGSNGVNDSNSVKIYNGSGIAETFQSGCFSCFVPGAQVGDGGVRVQSGKNMVFGDSGAARLVLDSSGNALQPRTAGGMVKAMMFFNGFASPGYEIFACFNSTRGVDATAAPCGFFLAAKYAPGDYVIDFGFEVDDRFFSLLPSYYAGQALLVCTASNGGDPAVCTHSGSLTVNQVEIVCSNCGGPAENKFYLLVY